MDVAVTCTVVDAARQQGKVQAAFLALLFFDAAEVVLAGGWIEVGAKGEQEEQGACAAVRGAALWHIEAEEGGVG